jgi:hypothetical protein
MLAAAVGLLLATPVGAAPAPQGMTEGFGPGAVVVPVRVPSPGGLVVVVCQGVPYLPGGSGEARLLVFPAPDGGWRVLGRLQPEGLTLRHPGGTELHAVGQDVGQVTLAPGQPEGLLLLSARYLGPAGAAAPALVVTFTLRVTVSAEGAADATVVRATCA